ncbi:MAG: DNA polymerase III subunit delta', partial [Candidatus Sumerlaeia bacterium]|nr:DNA polymerase III subunit delta' [Candidatus Sumerlaeia bacterium]
GMDLPKRLLGKMWELRQLPHTLLFSGPALSGKRSLAYALSKIVNCESGLAETTVCECRSCRLITRGMHPDLFVVEPRGATQTIQIEQLREIQDICNSPPIEGKYKIIIIVDADRLNPSAGNSALKLLEEPPSYVLLLLLTTQPHRLMPTIKSRCTSITIQPVAETEMEIWLKEQLDVSETTARLAAAFSGGAPGVALELARRNYLGRRDLLLRELDFMLNNGFPALFSVVDELAKRFNQKEIVDFILCWLRDMLVVKLVQQPASLIINKDAQVDIERLAEYYKVNSLFSAMKELIKANALTQRVLNKRLFVFVLFLRLGKLLKTS